MKIAKELPTAAGAVIVLTLLLGLAYPLAVTGVAQVAFPSQANGSQVEVDGKVVGSRLIARSYVVDTGRRDRQGNAIARPDPRYFQPRPSQSGYSATATYFSNRGPNSAVGRFFYRDQLAGYVELERPYLPGLTDADVPVDAVTTSGSGVDPHISRANASIQAHRVATVRHLALTRIEALVADHTDGRFLGVLGEPGVNVVELNLALDEEAAR